MSKKWPEAEEELLRRNYLELTHAELAVILNRTENSVRAKCSLLCLRKKSEDWTSLELKMLTEYYCADELDLDGLAHRLKRLKSNVCRKARELGLTDLKRPATTVEREHISRRAKQWHENNVHPRGYAGHTHNSKTRAKISVASLAAWRDPESGLNSEDVRQRASDRMTAQQRMNPKMRRGYSRSRAGKRADLDGLFVRSSWEANYARYLNFLIESGNITSWEYEPDRFLFHQIKRGTRSYTPDFKITELDGSIEYHEVKGWMDQKSKTRLRRMAKYYPGVKIVLIDKPVYTEIAKQFRRVLPGWES